MEDKLKDILNQSVAREMGVSIQYMWHHVMALGLASPAVKDIFKDISITEMKHAEAFAGRLFYLGGIPTSKPTEIKMGGDLRKMLQDDLEAETYALRLYREAIRLCREADDAVTRLLYEKVLAEEEEHYHTFSILLSELKPQMTNDAPRLDRGRMTNQSVMLGRPSTMKHENGCAICHSERSERSRRILRSAQDKFFRVGERDERPFACPFASLRASAQGDSIFS